MTDPYYADMKQHRRDADGRLVVESINPENSFVAVSSVSAWRAANRLILYRYGVGSVENGEVVSDSDAGEAGSVMNSTAEGSSPVEPQGGDVGSPEMDFFLRFQFGKLFQLPIVRCQNSTMLIGSLLYRQLITIRKFELWFTFGRHPLCFSLDEFHVVTSLNCG
ncbi:hypothetical protein F2Q69_00005512 [Brassica cretica]|uniref:DUF1985 domain-containing protein n=1 Tax=Brassica cretica TaxID=69181 RepID=A0A8S9NS81_BRACR|nr:hypothetical protein F2Q69_00005512 [Brassica cretica]